MTMITPLCRLLGINPAILSPEENILLQLDLNKRIRDELKEIFREKYKDYFMTINLSKEKENAMLEGKLLSLIVQDIIASGEYTAEGLAHYSNTHQEVIENVYFGESGAPSSTLFNKIIELHLTIRRELYDAIIKKIIAQYMTIAEITTTH